jgi:hypothetical protein
MKTVYTTTLPAGVTREAVADDLKELVGDFATIEIRPAARSGQGGKLGQIDPALWEIVVQLLDTQAAAAAVDTIGAAIGGYLLGKTGRKPKGEPTNKPDKD